MGRSPQLVNLPAMVEWKPCEPCKPLLQKQIMHRPLHTSISKMQSGLSDGCPVCNILLFGLGTLADKEGEILEPEASVILIPGVFGRPMKALYGGGAMSRSKAIQFYTEEGTNLPIYGIGPASSVLPDSSSTECLRFVKDLVSKCDKTHESCLSPNDVDPVLPTRVVDLGPPTTLVDDDQISPRLFIPPGEVRAPYIALSHCWGKGPQVVTISENLCSNTRSMDFNALPKTFRDAMIVTKALGYQYIWIDSLCIIQDSRKDWEQESAMMSRVFANASLTIAAYLASGDTIGFLGPRGNLTSKLYCWIGDQHVANIHIREQIVHDDSEMLPFNPLLTRAWVFQELLLSPRLLSFTASEIQWHCQTASWCECDNRHDTSLSLDVSTLRQRRTNLNATNVVPYNLWYRMVEAYSKLSLTKSGDRLPALSALARRFNQQFKDRYAAGLWVEDMSRGLEWKVSWESSSIGTMAEAYRAPSWSWASIDGLVQYETPVNSREDFQLTIGHDVIARVPIIPFYAMTEKSTVDPFGQVSIGWLHSKAPLIPAVLEIPEVSEGADEASIVYNIWRKSSKKEPHVQWPPISRCYFRPDVPLLQQEYETSKETAPGYRKRKQTVRRSKLKPSQYRPRVLARVWVLQLSYCATVLGRVEEQWGTKVYERIGTFIAPPYLPLHKDAFFQGGKDSRKLNPRLYQII